MQKRIITLFKDFNILYSEYSIAAAKDEINEFGLKIKNKYEREFIEYCTEIVDITFYILMCDMRMSTSVKVISIISKLQLFIRGQYDIDEDVKSAKFPVSSIEILDDKISDEIASLLLNKQANDYNLMEILNVLDLEKTMNRKNQIAPAVINRFIDRNSGAFSKLNFFVVFELVHFIKDNKEYETLKDQLYKWMDEKIRSLKDSNVSDTEAVLTFMETLCCPWIDNEYKNKISKTLFGPYSEEICKFAAKQKDLFIQWRNFNLDEAIQNNNSSEVY